MSMFDSSPNPLELFSVASVAQPQANTVGASLPDESNLFAQLLGDSSALLETSLPQGLQPTDATSSDAQNAPMIGSGKTLPTPDATLQQSVASSGGSLPPKSLEDFAVTLGIDRKLAQLLLSETEIESQAVQAAPIDQQLPIKATTLRAAPRGRQAIDVIDLPIGLVASLQPQVLPVKSALTQRPLPTPTSTPAMASAAVAPALEGLQLAQPTAQHAGEWAASPINTDPNPMPGTSTVSNAPLLSDTQLPVSTAPRAASVAAPVSGSASPFIELPRGLPQFANPMPQPAVARDVQITIAAAPLPTAQVINHAAPLADEDVLRWRTLISRGVAKQAPAQVQAAQEFLETDAAVPATPTTGFAGNGTVPTVVAAKTSLALAGTLARIGAEPAPSVQPTGVQPQPALTDAVSSMPQAAHGSDQSAVGVTQSHDAQDYHSRAEQFTEQVGQRMLQALRTERWTVSVSLEPRNLGPIDISLNVNGNDVAANMQVGNAQVQRMLETGLDRLRDSFAAAGYALSDCSFSAAGGRQANQHPDARLPVQALYMQPQRKPSYVAPLVPAAMAGSDRSSSDIDLYV